MESQADVVDVLLGATWVQTAFRGTEASHCVEAVHQARASLRRLRALTSTADLVHQTPGEIHQLGYRKAMLSRLQGPIWRPRASKLRVSRPGDLRVYPLVVPPDRRRAVAARTATF